MTNKFPILYFDIEAGGLEGAYNSILSISYQKGTQKGNFYAKPTIGSQLSRWSEEHVWKPIKQKAVGNEAEALQGFLNVLEQHKGGTLAGWNIGTQIAPQYLGNKGDDFRGPRGFDIPMLLTRAKKYGLQERYEEALKNVEIRDVGREYAYKVAKAVHPYRQLVDEDLWRSVDKYVSLGSAFEASGMSEKEASYALAKSRYQLSGWKQELIHNLMFNEGYAAHESASDIAALRRITEEGKPIVGSPEFASSWNKAALQNTIANKLVKGPRSWEKPSEIFPNLARRASAFGVNIEDVLIKTAAERSTTVEALRSGSGVLDEWTKIEGSFLGAGAAPRVANIFERGLTATTRFAKKHPYSVGAGIGLAALFALKPLSWFSGRDGAYNTIEGLPHGGEAERMRHIHTDFGSGYQGLYREALEEVLDYGSRIYMKRREGKLITSDEDNRIHSKDDYWNVIEGLRHGGKAEVLRRAITDFGSGWDALRGLTRAGETFEAMLASKEFKGALSAAKELGRIGEESAFGKVFKMETTFRGQNIAFARKLGIIGKNEVEAQRAFQDWFSPTVYHAEGGKIDMELITGESAASRWSRDPWLGEKLVEQKSRFEEVMAQFGWEHGDFHAGNMMISPTIGGKDRWAVIDFGFAEHYTVPTVARDSHISLSQSVHSHKNEMQDFAAEMENIMSSPSIDKQSWQNNHKIAMKSLTRSSFRPGRGHIKKST